MLTVIPHRSIYQDYYSQHMLSHETQSTISWIGSVQLFFLYAGGVVGGPLFDRYGAKVSTFTVPPGSLTLANTNDH